MSTEDSHTAQEFPLSALSSHSSVGSAAEEFVTLSQSMQGYLELNGLFVIHKIVIVVPETEIEHRIVLARCGGSWWDRSRNGPARSRWIPSGTAQRKKVNTKFEQKKKCLRCLRRYNELISLKEPLRDEFFDNSYCVASVGVHILRIKLVIALCILHISEHKIIIS